ncbi:MAG: RNA polymerase subunit sigma [Verrucomicrobia bacterium]|nr:MAG: RNA polymerase subunit sigma [Verrucomicrobiota bacterium]
MDEKHGIFTSTRWSLIERLKNWEDNESWQRFFETYWRLIYRTAERAGLSSAEAQEVVQETVLSVAKNMRQFKADPALGSFKSWLLNITRWRIADQFRKRVPAQKPSPASSDDATGTDVLERVADPGARSWEQLWEEEWRQNLLDAAMDSVKKRINPIHYKVFYLHVLKKLPSAKVAAVMKMNIAQVYIIKQRVTGQLKKEVERLQTRLP